MPNFFYVVNPLLCPFGTTVVQAMIMAPDNTPYDSGCFQFDIFFPDNYPNSPPKVASLLMGRVCVPLLLSVLSMSSLNPLWAYCR
jgi:ubiquitin-protein ligase